MRLQYKNDPSILMLHIELDCWQPVFNLKRVFISDLREHKRVVWTSSVPRPSLRTQSDM